MKHASPALALLVLPVLAAASCFTPIDAPACGTLADCPAGAGYRACEDGLCFREGSTCESAAPVAGDGCCALLEGDRSADTDCLTLDADLGPCTLATPSADTRGDLYVAGARVIDGVSRIAVWRIPADGGSIPPETAGEGYNALPAVVGAGRDVYVAHGGGVVRYATPDLIPVQAVPSGTPVGGLFATHDASRPVVGWVDSAGGLTLYDEEKATVTAFDLKSQGLGEGDAFPPVVSGSGRRAWVLWKSGLLLAVSTRDNPLGPVASLSLDAEVVGAPIESGGVVYVPIDGGTAGHRIAAVDESANRLERTWTLDLGGTLSGRLLVDSTGALVALLQDGSVRIVRDHGALGSVVGIGAFGTPLADRSALIGADGRIVAVTASGRTVLTLQRIDDASEVRLEPGLRFDVAVPLATSPLHAGGRIAFGTGSGHVLSYVLPGAPAAAGFSGDGGDAAHSCRVAVIETDDE
jgi:hypothetical protein